MNSEQLQATLKQAKESPQTIEKEQAVVVSHETPVKTVTLDVDGEKPIISSEARMIDAIMQMAQNPNVDVEKMERLLAMQLDLMARQAKKEFYTALTQIQNSLPEIKGSGSIKNKSEKEIAKYITLEDMMRALGSYLKKYKFSLTHDKTEVDGKLVTTTTLGHEGGHELAVRMVTPYDKPNQLKSDIQCAMGTRTSAKRANIADIFNIILEDENKADPMEVLHKQTIDEEQIKEIRKLMEETNTQEADFVAHLKVAGIEDITYEMYAKATFDLKGKAAKMKKLTNEEK